MTGSLSDWIVTCMMHLPIVINLSPHQVLIQGHLSDSGWKASAKWDDAYLKARAVGLKTSAPLPITSAACDTKTIPASQRR